MTKILKLQKTAGPKAEAPDAVDYSTLSVFQCQNG